MKCPFCAYLESKVVDSRPADEGASIRRRRECLSCHKRFTTYETMESLPLMVVKKDGSRQSFDRNKVMNLSLIHIFTELSGPGVSFECSAQRGMHINEDHFIAEIIDPDTGEVLPEGSEGELVFTSITKKAFPLLRYRTRDICTLTREKCPCGRTHVKMSKPRGRTDDMLIIRGVNVFPSQIETVLLNYGYPANYQIIVDRVHSTDTLEMCIRDRPGRAQSRS